MKKTILSMFLMIISMCIGMCVACGDKQAKDGGQAEAAVEEKAESASSNEADADKDDNFPDTDIREEGTPANELPGIRSAWASKKLTGVAAGKTADIERFALAFCKQYAKYKPNKYLCEYLQAPSKYDEETADYRVSNQKKSGYLSCAVNFDFDWLTDCCYWNRSNGHKLVAFWMTETHVSWDIDEHLLAFYDYDPATDTMTPEPNLTKKVEEAMRTFDSYHVVLPLKGKDIGLEGRMIFDHSKDDTLQPFYLLRWNGNDFKVENGEKYKLQIQTSDL